MQSGSSTRPSTFAVPGWPEYYYFDLTAVALGIAGLIGAGYVAFLGYGETLDLYGRPPIPEAVAESRRLYGAAAVIAAAVPPMGLLLCVWVRRRGVAYYFAVLFLLGGLFAAQAYNHLYVDHQPQPVERDVRVCQEHSGGDNRCPGG